jgi:toxin ParE1/3/4
MGKYRLSEQAVDDLEDIFVYTIDTFGLSQAEKYKTELETGLKRVAKDPRLGRAWSGRTQTFFQYNCGQHAIFFAKQPGGIFVVRILHLARDFARHLPE